MNARSGFLTTAVQAIALAWMLVLCPPGGVPPAAGAVSTYVNITAPSGVTTVGGTITIATSESANIRWINVFIDDVWVGSNPYNALPPYLVSWNSSTVADGKHKLSVTGYDISQAAIATRAIVITVQNDPLPSCVKIITPAAGAAVRGSSVAITTNDTCSGLWFESLYIDGSHVSDFAPGAVVLNSSSLSNAEHILQVTSQSMNPGSVVLGSASEPLNVENGPVSPTPAASPRVSPTATPAPTSTGTPTPQATPTAKATALAHLSNLAPNATLPAESTCARFANQSNFPETSPENANDGTGWNANNQIWTTPSYFYANAGRNGLAPPSDFAAVDGNYAGTTQDIIRWAACKWGVDEDWAYAETAEETGSWTNACAQMHGGSTCHETGDCGNYDSDSGGETPNLSFMGFPVTDGGGSFVGPNAYTGRNSDGATCSSVWSSWSIIQSKARFFEWYTWPMLAVSTAWVRTTAGPSTAPVSMEITQPGLAAPPTM